MGNMENTGSINIATENTNMVNTENTAKKQRKDTPTQMTIGIMVPPHMPTQMMTGMAPAKGNMVNTASTNTARKQRKDTPIQMMIGIPLTMIGTHLDQHV